MEFLRWGTPPRLFRFKLSILVIILFIASASANLDKCTVESDCGERYSCNMSKQECERNALFPLEMLDYFGVFLLAVLMSLATSAGIGGGEIIVPIIKIMFDFSQKEASPISQCCIMLAGLTRFIINYRKKHPYKDAVPIDYNAAMILMPAIFFGASIGQMLREILPDISQDLILLLILGYCIFSSIKGSIVIWKKESADREKEKVGTNDSSNGERSIDPIGAPSEQEDPTPDVQTKKPEDAKENDRHEKTHWQFKKLVPIWILLLALIGRAILTHSGVTHIPKCGVTYWGIYLVYVLCCGLAMTYSIIKIKQDIKHHHEVDGDEIPEGEVELDNKKIVTIVSISVMAGAVAAIIGVGGGVIYLPMLLMIGYPPFVASSTSMFMVMYAAGANFTSFTIAGETNLAYAFWLAFWTCFGVVFGVTVSNKIVQKTGRQSIFIILLAFVLMICWLLTIVFMVTSTVSDLDKGNNVLDFGSLCS